MKPTLRVEPNYIIALVLVVAVGVCYQPVRDFDFIVLDDPAYIVDNHWVKNGLTRSGLYWSVSAIHAANWHPLTWISHMLDCELFRCEPGAHHLVNVFFHLINSFLLWILMRRISGRIWPAGVAAILFAVHPINVEVVAWVAQRKTLLCTLFGLLTLLAYHRYTENRKTATYLPVLVFFALGLMAKPMIVTLPGVMLLLDYWPLNRLSVEPGRKCRGVGGWAPLIAEKAPLLGISSVSAVITFFAQHHGGAVAAGDALSTGMRISNAVVSYAGYLKKMMWPEQLAVVYPHPLFIPPSQVALSAVLLSGITLFVLLMRRRHPYLPVGWFWYMGTLLPVIGFIQVGVQAMADRYLYIPMIGLLLMLVWGVNACAARWRMGWKVPLASASILLALFMSMTYRQIGYWQDSIRLFQHTLALTRDNYLGHHSLGLALFQKGKTAEAVDQYRRSIAIRPDYDAPHVDMGAVLFSKGRLDEAVHHFSEAIRINPKNAVAQNNKGAVLALQGKDEEAMHHYQRALEIQPSYAGAHRNMGNLLLAKGAYPAAVYHFRKTIQLDSRNKNAHNSLGIALAVLGSEDEAVFHFSEAVRLDPNFAEADHNFRRIASGSLPDATLRLKPADTK